MSLTFFIDAYIMCHRPIIKEEVGVSKYQPISRRGFILGGIAATTMLGLGVTSKVFIGNDQDYRSLCGGELPEVLSNRELGILTVFCSRIVSPLDGAPSVTAARTARRIDREMLFASPKMVSDVKASLLYLEFSPVLNLKLEKFTSMNIDSQNIFIKSLQNSKNVTERSIYSGLRFMIVFFYYTDERVWPVIGYDKPHMPRKHFPAGNQISNLPTLIQSKSI